MDVSRSTIGNDGLTADRGGTSGYLGVLTRTHARLLAVVRISGNGADTGVCADVVLPLFSIPSLANFTLPVFSPFDKALDLVLRHHSVD